MKAIYAIAFSKNCRIQCFCRVEMLCEIDEKVGSKVKKKLSCEKYVPRAFLRQESGSKEW